MAAPTDSGTVVMSQHHPSPMACCLCLLPVACSNNRTSSGHPMPLPTAHCPPPAACCLLPTACGLPPKAHISSRTSGGSNDSSNGNGHRLVGIVPLSPVAET